MLQCRDWRRDSRRSSDRRQPVGSTAFPDASVRRRRAAHRTTRPGRVGSALPLFFLEGQVPSIHHQGMRNGEACALRGRRKLASEAIVQRSGRRPSFDDGWSPRHVLESRERPSALSAVRLRWLCAISVSLWFSWCSWCLGGENQSLPVSCERSTGGRFSQAAASQLTPSRKARARSVLGHTARTSSQKTGEWSR